jgi:hypothetical protein
MRTIAGQEHLGTLDHERHVLVRVGAQLVGVLPRRRWCRGTPACHDGERKTTAGVAGGGPHLETMVIGSRSGVALAAVVVAADDPFGLLAGGRRGGAA